MKGIPILYFEFNIDNGYFRNIKTNDIVKDSLKLYYYQQDKITGEIYDTIYFDDINDYTVIENNCEQLLVDKLDWKNAPFFAFISTKTNKITQIEHFPISTSDSFYSVCIQSDIKDLLQNNLDNINVVKKHRFNLASFESNNFKSNTILFFLESSNKFVQDQIEKLKRDLIIINIEKLKKINIDKGIIFKYRNIITPITDTQLDRDNMQNKIQQLITIYFENSGEEISFKSFEYNKLQKELQNFEFMHEIYSECLIDYIKNNINKIDIDCDYIYYGYLNDIIINDINKKIKEMSIDEIFK